MRTTTRRVWSPTSPRASAHALVALALVLSACASAPPPAPATSAAPLPPLPRSSIAAVVLHRGELGLTDDQVRQLELIDQRREAEDAAIRDELAKHHAQKPAGQAPASGGGGASSASGSPAGGGNGGGMRGGGMGMGRGGGMRGRMPRASGTDATKGANAEATAQDRMDDDDTKAYLEGEEILTEAQRARGRDIAEDYREHLYDRRARAPGTAGK